MDWVEPDTTTIVGVGDAVIRSLPGDIFDGVLPRYESTSFEAVAVINDSIGIATSFDGDVVGLDLRHRKLVSLPGLPSRGMRVMRCGSTALLRVDSSVVALRWDGSKFQSTTVSQQYRVTAHCSITDSTFAIATSDLQVYWMNVQSGDTIASRQIFYRVQWMHPVHARAVALYYENTGFEAQSMDQVSTLGIGNKGPLRHLVGFTPRRNGESMVMQWTGDRFQSMVFGDSSRISTDGAAGISGEIVNSKSIVTAGLALPRGTLAGKAWAYSSLSSAIGYLDTTMTVIGQPIERISIANEEWVSVHTQDNSFIAAVIDKNYLSEGVLAWSVDGGAHWDATVTPGMFPIRMIVATSTKRVFVNVNNTLIYRFDPPAMNATLVSRHDVPGQFSGFDMAANGDTIMVYASDSLHISYDAGSTWFRRPYFYQADSYSQWDCRVLYTEKNVIVSYAMPTATYAVTTDWGASWKQLHRTADYPGPIWSFSRTSNGTWISVAANESERFYLTTCAQSDTMFENHGRAIGAVFEDERGDLQEFTPTGLHNVDASTWTISDSVTPIRWPHREPAHSTSLTCLRPRSALMSYGLWLKVIGQPQTTGVTNDPVVSADDIPFPNPATTTVHSRVAIQRVRTLFGDVVWEPGEYNASRIDVSSWSSGTYVMETGTREHPQFIPFIVVH